MNDLPSDDMAFINAKIGGALIDFETYVDFDSTFSTWQRNYVTGRVGDQPPAANHNFTMLWETGQSAIQPVESLHCSYDNKTCYTTKTVPVIFGVSANSGFKTGGQELTVKGYGFDTGKIDAKVDGVPCNVTSFAKDQFTCEVQPAASASVVDVPHIGQHGIRRMLVNSSMNANQQYVWLDNFDDMTKPDWTRQESLAMNIEMPPNLGDRMSNNFTGWFVPPATTRYRFYMSCDDHCRLYLGNTPNSTVASKILDLNTAINFRDYWRANDGKRRISDWISLTEGEHYFIQTSVAEGGGGDHFSVAVEIEQSAI